MRIAVSSRRAAQTAGLGPPCAQSAQLLAVGSAPLPACGNCTKKKAYVRSGPSFGPPVECKQQSVRQKNVNRLRLRGAEVLGKERHHLAVQSVRRVAAATVVIAVAEDALDLERIELFLEGVAELRVVDPLPGLGVLRQRAFWLVVKEEHRRVVGRDVVDGRRLLVHFVRAWRIQFTGT